jgi:hypothetical protein
MKGEKRFGERGGGEIIKKSPKNYGKTEDTVDEKTTKSIFRLVR